MSSGTHDRRDRQVTLADVAERAGVAVSTASLAFSNGNRIAPGTRQRVLTAAAELAYGGPDPTAASLRTGRSGVVGAIIGERLRYAFADPVAAQVLDGLTEILGTGGAALLLIAEPHGPDAGHPLDSYRGPMDAAVIVSCALDDEAVLEPLRRRRVPVVAIGGPRTDDFSFVGIDERAGSSRLATHLRELGHDDVVIVSTPLCPDGTRGVVSPERRQMRTYRDVAERVHGVAEVFGDVALFEAAVNSVAEGIRAGRELLADPSGRPTAVVCHSDLLATGVIRAATELGVQVPDDMSVAGFDGIDTTLTDAVELTTVVQPSVEKGRAAGRVIVAQVEGQPAADVELAVTLRIGTTTAPRRLR